MFKRRFSVMVDLCFSILVLGVLLIIPSKSLGDIYRFIDKNGVVRFTNVPTEPGGELIIKEKRFDPRSIKYEHLISKISKKYMMDDSLVKAVIRVESNFDTNAVSRAGAIGLMQLMPETAKDLKVSDPFDPEQNIEGGVRYLKYLIDRFGDNLPVAIAAYHAGEGVVKKYNGIPPFDSTQRYVEMVLKQFKKYKE